MERLITYKKKNVTKKWLLDNNFYYNRILSNDLEKEEAYSYRFNVYKYGSYATLECEFTIILGNDKVIVDVYDFGTRDKYAPFYYCEYGNYDKILNIIMSNISKKAKQLGFVEL